MEKLICVSQSVVNHCQHFEGVAASKLVSIPNGIDFDASDSNPQTWETLGIPPAARVLLFVGRITDQKGIVDFVKYQGDFVLKKLPDHHLVIIGEGDRFEQIRELRLTSEFADRIHLVGWQPNAIGWMKQSELLFLPSKYEGMPNVVLEAMSVGKPVVVFEVDGVRELLGFNTAANAQIATAEDSAKFAEMMIATGSDPLRQKELSSANQTRVTDHFQLHQQLEKYERLYLGKAIA